MTSADFNERYQLVRQVTEGAIRTFHAVAQTGAVVMVHILAPQARDEHRRVGGLMDRLEPGARQRIVEVIDVDGAPVIVTRFLPEFDSLGGWLEAHVRQTQGVEQADREPPAPTPQQPPPTDPPGEFTRLFRTQTRPGDADAVGPSKPSSPSPTASSQGTSANDPGEFTQLFATPSSEEETVDPADVRREVPPPAPAPPSPPGHGEGESTGEFTRWFARQAGPEPDDRTPEWPGLSYGSQTTSGRPGGLAHTDWRSRLASPSFSADPNVPADMVRSERPSDGIPGSGAGKPAPPPLPGSGDYARVLSSDRAAPFPPRPPVPPPPAPHGPSRTLLVWGLSAIVATAVVAVVLFALLGREGQGPAEPPAGEAQEAPAAAAAPEETEPSAASDPEAGR